MNPLIKKLKELEARMTPGQWKELHFGKASLKISFWDSEDLSYLYAQDAQSIPILRNSLTEIIQLLERAEREREAAEAFEKEVEAIGCTLLEVQVRHDQRRRDEFVVKKFQALERFKAQKWDIRDSYRESKG